MADIFVRNAFPSNVSITIYLSIGQDVIPSSSEMLTILENLDF